MSNFDVSQRLVLRSPKGGAVAITILLLIELLLALSNTKIAAADSTISSDWSEVDIGNPSVGGNDNLSNGIYTVSGNGSGVGGNWDKFHLLSKVGTGEGRVTAHLTGFTHSGSGTGRYGVMYREDLIPWQASRFVSLALDSNHNLVFQYRTSVNGNANYVTGPTNLAEPIYLRIVRQGNTFIGQYATACGYDDCYSTIPNASVNLDMVVSPNEGAFVNSGDDSNLDSASFDQLDPGYNSASVNIDWGQGQGSTSALSFGLNGFHALDPNVAGNGSYTANLNFMAPGLLRYHNWGMLSDASNAEGWLDTANQTWNAAKIDNALSSLGYRGGAILLNIPGWPSWMDTNNDGYLDADKFDAYAQFCADLVRIVNITYGGHHVTYWEVTNERDDPYYVQLVNKGQPDRLNELIDIYNRAARAMKSIDSSIQTGGPAFARADLSPQVVRFVQGTSNQSNPATLDFLTFHAYASGSPSDSDEYIYDRAYNPTQSADSFASYSSNIRAILNQNGAASVPLWLDEYNIQGWGFDYNNPGTWDSRMRNNKGAVFDALTLIKTTENGVAATAAWNDKDGIQGKLDDSYNRRVGANTFYLFNNFLMGNRYAATTRTNTTTIVPMAVINPGNDRHAIALVNRSPLWQRVFINFNGWTPSNPTLNRYKVSSGGYSIDTVSFDELTNSNGRQFWVEPDSVTVVTTQ